MKVDIAGVKIDNISKSEAIERIERLVRGGEPGFAVTPYSEIVVIALNDPEYKKILNEAALSLPDGIGILWAAHYLASNRSLLSTLFAILFKPSKIRSVIKEKITGSGIIYDICALAERNGFSLALAGAGENVAEKAAGELKKLYPSLKVNLAYSPKVFNNQAVEEIARSNSDILLVAYSPPKQEKWIAENLPKLNVKLAIGLGGTFDYIAGKRPKPPNFLSLSGLEWLWRLITQPWRIKRIWNAVPVFIWKIYKYKLCQRKSE